MPPNKFTRTQLRVADIHDSDETLQTAESIGEFATHAVVAEAKIDYDDDDLCDQGDEDRPIDDDIGDLHSQTVDEDCLDVATQNRLMLEMLLENQAQWKAEQNLDRERMGATRERMVTEQDTWAAERAERAGRSIQCPRQNIYETVDPVPYCGSAKELGPFLDTLHLNFNSHGHLHQQRP